MKIMKFHYGHGILLWYIQTYILMHVCLPIYIHTHPCLTTSIHVYVNTYTYTYIHTYMHLSVSTSILTYIHHNSVIIREIMELVQFHYAYIILLM